MESRRSRHCGLTMSQVTRMTRTGSMLGARKTTRPGGQDAGGATMAADSRSGQLEACRGRSATWRRVLASYGTGSPIE